MSAREWKPGDVAVRTWRGHEAQRAVVVDGCSFAFHVSDPHWHLERGGWDPLNAGEHPVSSARFNPAVVLDPEDREQVERLLVGYWDANKQNDAIDRAELVENMQSSLRSLLTPPKPPEPQGLGAVVEDAQGRVWVRTADSDCQKPWSYANNYTDDEWGHINVVRVLSEGVTP